MGGGGTIPRGYIGMAVPKGMVFFIPFDQKLGTDLIIWVWNQVSFCTLCGLSMFSADAVFFFFILFRSDIG